MGLPRKLKNFNLFQNGVSFMGMVPEVTLPKLSRKMEEYRAGGMSGPVSVDFGNEALSLEWSAGGLIAEALKQYGAHAHGAVQLRFAGAYQEDDDGTVAAVEVVVPGNLRHRRIRQIRLFDFEFGQIGAVRHAQPAVIRPCHLLNGGFTAKRTT